MGGASMFIDAPPFFFSELLEEFSTAQDSEPSLVGTRRWAAANSPRRHTLRSLFDD